MRFFVFRNEMPQKELRVITITIALGVAACYLFETSFVLSAKVLLLGYKLLSFIVRFFIVPDFLPNAGW